MKTVETVGKTVDEAVFKALDELGISHEHAEVEILSEPSHGLFGLIGTKQARVRVTEKIVPEEFIKEFLSRIMAHMGISGEMKIHTNEESLKININGSKMGMLIGKRGQTLNALQYLLNVIYHKKFSGQRKRVILDVEDYREKREQTLKILAAKLARQVARYRKEIVLEPMSPQERRIIHTALQENPSVATHSEGEDPYRKVVIAPK